MPRSVPMSFPGGSARSLRQLLPSLDLFGGVGEVQEIAQRPHRANRCGWVFVAQALGGGFHQQVDELSHQLRPLDPCFLQIGLQNLKGSCDIPSG